VVLDIVAAAVVTALGSLFAGADVALSEISDSRLQALSADATTRGATFRRFVHDPNRVLSRWLVGRVVALSAASALLAEAAHASGLHQLVVPSAVVGAVMTYGTFTEILGTLARRRPEATGFLALVFLRPFEWIVAPLADPLALLGGAIGRRVPKTRNADARLMETEVVWVVSEGEKSGAIATGPAEMIRKVLDFKDLTAREVMVPRMQILGIEIATPLRKAVALVAEQKHSRYPVYRETLDNIVGQLYAKDLFGVVRDGKLDTTKLADVVRSPVMFVSEGQPAAKILAEMRSKRLHMAVVSDEFGGTAGLITLEDIIEEIVGDIRDEKDRELPIQALADGRVLADASVSLAEVEAAVGTRLPYNGEFESLGGLIVNRAGRVPQVGAMVTVDGLKLIVREADETRVVRVEIIPERPTQPAPAP
jgi:CBS domain containing-hemolysin-like protein